jgi:hypothetical protein
MYFIPQGVVYGTKQSPQNSRLCHPHCIEKRKNKIAVRPYSLQVPCNENRHNNHVVLSGYLGSANASLLGRCLKIATQKPSRIHMFFWCIHKRQCGPMIMFSASPRREKPEPYGRTRVSIGNPCYPPLGEAASAIDLSEATILP